MTRLIDVMAKAPGKLGTEGMLQKAGCKGQRKDRSVERFFEVVIVALCYEYLSLQK